MKQKIVLSSVLGAVIALCVGVFAAVLTGTIIVLSNPALVTNPAIGPISHFVITFAGQIFWTFLGGVVFGFLPTFVLFVAYALLLMKFEQIRGPIIGVGCSFLISCGVLLVAEMITHAIRWDDRTAIALIGILSGILVGTEWVRRKLTCPP